MRDSWPLKLPSQGLVALLQLEFFPLEKFIAAFTISYTSMKKNNTRNMRAAVIHT